MTAGIVRPLLHTALCRIRQAEDEADGMLTTVLVMMRCASFVQSRLHPPLLRSRLRHESLWRCSSAHAAGE